MTESKVISIDRLVAVLQKHGHDRSHKQSYGIYSYHILSAEHSEERKVLENNRCSSREIIEDRIESMTDTVALDFLSIAYQNIRSVFKANPYWLETRDEPSSEFYRELIADCSERYGIRIEEDLLIGIDQTDFLSLPAVNTKELITRASAYYWVDLLEWIKGKKENIIQKEYSNQGQSINVPSSTRHDVSIHSVAPVPSVDFLYKARLNIDALGPAQGETFIDLFFNASDIDTCVEALRLIRPERPVINATGRWVGGESDGSKGILVGWIDRLEYCNKIRKMQDRKKLISLLEEYFPGLKMGASARIFANTAKDSIRLGFAALLPK
ncbi:hypothetical protein [Spirosoma validum]|uniref:Uncharacterized protein n=1 Tax=Spirosoma validum TaxID=2771355 RepID=A0A927AZF2_9BACT|nr:hypothetical protein [Spirosoma validum]MBD2752608.1 hypothetical protein [Spirosoma validum]